MTLAQNDLDLKYSSNFINIISCLYLPTYRSQAIKHSEKSCDLEI